jgi:hypothetical protein
MTELFAVLIITTVVCSILYLVLLYPKNYDGL